MFIIGAIITYLAICLISGILQVRSFKVDHFKIYNADIAQKIMWNPPKGKGIIEEYVARTSGQDKLMPVEWYELKAKAGFNTWALAITGIVMFFWNDLAWLSFEEPHDAAELYGNMAKGLFAGIAMIFLMFFKAILLGIAYYIMVAVPNSQALNIEKDYWKNR